MKTPIFSIGLVIVMLCSHASAQWMRTNGPSGNPWVFALAVSGTNLIAATANYVFLSTDDGMSWNSVSAGLPVNLVLSLAVSDTNVFAGTAFHGVYLLTNNGTTWTAVNSGLPYPNGDAHSAKFQCLAVNRTAIYVGTGGYGVYMSTNNGNEWTAVNSGLTDTVVYCLAFSGEDLFAGTKSGVFLSTNGGASWSPMNSGLTGAPIVAFAVIGTEIFAATGTVWDGSKYRRGDLFVSTNSGASWTSVYPLGLPDYTAAPMVVGCFAVNETTLLTNIYVASIGGWSGVFRSLDKGTSWTPVDQGLGDTAVVSFAVHGANLFAGTLSAGVWRLPLSEIVSAKGLAGGMPGSFALHQNYPNPFNPSTTIKYELPGASHVNLSVFDILGREVSVLVNDRRDAGVYEVKFDGSNLASGIYFYRLQAGNFIQTKRSMILK